MMIEMNMIVLKKAYKKSYPLKIDTIAMMFINIAKSVDKKDIQRNFVFSKNQVNVWYVWVSIKKIDVLV